MALLLVPTVVAPVLALVLVLMLQGAGGTDRPPSPGGHTAPAPPDKPKPWALSLPTFRTQAALEADPGWRDYLHAVYGADSAFGFPIELPKFNFFYQPLLPPAERARLSLVPSSRGHVPRLGDAFGVIDGWFDPAVSAKHRHKQPASVPALNVAWIYQYDELRSCGWGTWPRKVRPSLLAAATRGRRCVLWG